MNTFTHAKPLDKEVAKSITSLFLGALFISLGPVVGRLSCLGPVGIAFYRMLFSLPFFYFLNREGRKNGKLYIPLKIHHALLIFLTGFFFAGDMVCFYIALNYTKVANATFIVNLAPFFVVVFNWFFLKQTPKKALIFALFCSIIGIFLLSGVSFQDNPESFKGDCLSLIAAFFYAAYILNISFLRKCLPAQLIMYYSTIVSLIFIGGLAAYQEVKLDILSSRWEFIYMMENAFIAHVAGQGLIAYAMHILSSSISSIGLLLQPVIVMVACWLLFQETLNSIQLLGASLILIGIFLANLFTRS